ncbi:hypothetical protein [Sphingomicrobium aestuariivivum]|uniref:hypothetical protein n=1 Tax=Sphingomicrobium aestuariivivum TaxID=1582356 RepID=UPI001FD6E41D|nr:hypothetical protein [Sphingomicrobium aestuariivivum]MCJ8190312.1 hypothetical protein [Sphingomicrobium aestuariivivum]
MIRWNSYGSPAVLCEGEMRVIGEGPEVAALGPLPTGPIWFDVAPEAKNVAFFLEPHDPPDDHGFVHHGKRLLVLRLPQRLGNWRDFMRHQMVTGTHAVFEVSRSYRDEVQLSSAWGLPDRNLFAMGEAYRCEAMPAPTGTRIRFEAVVRPRRGGPEPLDEEIRVEVDAIIPQPFGARLHAVEDGQDTLDPSEIDWRRQRFEAYMPGRLSWGQEARFTGPFVQFYEMRDTLDAPKLLRLVPASLARTSSLGGYTASTRSDGPQINLPLNWKTIAALLSEKPSARLRLEGDAIGYLDGQSGRSVYECGGYRRQEIEMIDMALDWDGEWLRLRANGLLSTRQYDLGPRFEVRLDIHAHWLAANGRLPRAKPTGATP